MTLKKQMLSYTAVNILNAAVPFLLLPILTVYLSPGDYGLLSLIQLLMLVSLPLVLMNTHGLLTIEYSKLPLEKFKRLVSTIIWIPIGGFLLLEILFYFLEVFIVQYFHIPVKYVYYIPVFLLVQSIPSLVSIIFQAKKDPFNFGKYKITMTIVNVLLSLLLVVTFNLGWEGRLFGIVSTFFIFTIIGLVILFKLKLLSLSLDKQFLKEALIFGIPLIPHSIAGIFLAMSDRIFLSNMLGNDAVGIYSVAFQISSMVTIIMSSINQAWAPNLYEKLNNDPTLNEKKQIVKQTYIIMAGMSIITILFIIVSPVIYDIFIDKAYYQGKELSRFITLAFLFQGFYFMITNYIFYSKKTYILSYITVFCLAVVFISNYYLIQRFGIKGSAYAMLITWVIYFFISWAVSNKIYSMPWRLK